MIVYLLAILTATILLIYKVKKAQRYAWRRNLLAQKTLEEINFDRVECARGK